MTNKLWQQLKFWNNSEIKWKFLAFILDKSYFFKNSSWFKIFYVISMELFSEVLSTGKHPNTYKLFSVKVPVLSKQIVLIFPAILSF